MTSSVTYANKSLAVDYSSPKAVETQKIKPLNQHASRNTTQMAATARMIDECKRPLIDVSPAAAARIQSNLSGLPRCFYMGH